MTINAPPPGGVRGRRRWAALAVAAVAVALGAAGGTYALWSDGDPAALPQLRAGDLDIALGVATWHETSPDVAAPPRTIEVADFLAAPGDVVVLSQEVVTTLEGDNVAGQLTVRWGDRQAQLPDGVAATYQVHDRSGAVTRKVPVGAPANLPAPPEGRATWTVTVEFVLDAEADPHYADGPASRAPVPFAHVGDLVVDLRQVRPGVGATR